MVFLMVLGAGAGGYGFGRLMLGYQAHAMQSGNMHLSVNGKPITEPYITPGFIGLIVTLVRNAGRRRKAAAVPPVH